MNRPITLVPILLIIFFGLTDALAQPPGYNYPWDRGPMQRPKREPRKKQTDAADANSASADANSVGDPNQEKYKMFEGLAEVLEDVNQQAQTEAREWMRGEAEHKTKLIEAANEQVTAEYNVLRALAVEEGAVKTTAAIDKLLADRQKRLEKNLEAIEEQKKRLRERDSRRDRDRDRTKDRDRGRDRDRSRDRDSGRRSRGTERNRRTTPGGPGMSF